MIVKHTNPPTRLAGADKGGCALYPATTDAGGNGHTLTPGKKGRDGSSCAGAARIVTQGQVNLSFVSRGDCGGSLRLILHREKMTKNDL